MFMIGTTLVMLRIVEIYELAFVNYNGFISKLDVTFILLTLFRNIGMIRSNKIGYE